MTTQFQRMLIDGIFVVPNGSRTGSSEWVILTTDHAASSYEVPVLVDPQNQSVAYGPGDVVGGFAQHRSDGPYAEALRRAGFTVVESINQSVYGDFGERL